MKTSSILPSANGLQGWKKCLERKIIDYLEHTGSLSCVNKATGTVRQIISLFTIKPLLSGEKKMQISSQNHFFLYSNVSKPHLQAEPPIKDKEIGLYEEKICIVGGVCTSSFWYCCWSMLSLR